MISVWVDGIGIFAPGLTGWAQATAVLTGHAAYAPGELPKLAPALLPADVRRRTTDHIRMAVEVAGEAVSHAQADATALWSVFATSDSDGAICHNICEEVAKDVPEVSPTRFHNSVNNAPAGYWCMAVQSRAPSTSISCFDASFAAGLIEAGAQVLAEQRRVLLVAHDEPFPEPLHGVRPMTSVFGVALVLAPAQSPNSLARLDVQIDPALQAPSRMTDAALDGLRTGNPAARSLPVLAALARRETVALNLTYVNSQTLQVRVVPA